MEKQKVLELITNSFIAAGKLRELSPQNRTRTGESGNMQINPESFLGILQIISDISPERYRTPISTAINRSRTYMETYGNLRNHITSLNKPRLRSGNIIKTLEVIKPVLGSNEASVAEKVIKIYELLKND